MRIFILLWCAVIAILSLSGCREEGGMTIREEDGKVTILFMGDVKGRLRPVG